KNCSAWDSPCTTGVCDPLDGQCHPEPGPAGVACGDDTGCSTGVCEADGNCRLTFAPDGEVCTYGAGVEGNCLAGSCFLSNPCTGGYITTFANCADSGWTLTGDWQCGQPSSGPMRALLGDNVIATNLGGNYSFNIAWGSHTATSPWIDLTEAVAPWVSFYAWHEPEGGSFDGWNVKVSTNGTTWTLLTDVSPPYNTTVNGQAAWGGGPSGRFSELRANLAAYAGQQVKLRIDMRSDGVIVAPGIYVGAVIVGDGSSAPVLIAGTPQNASAGTPWFFEPQRVGGGANLAWEIVGGVNHGWIVMDRHT